VFFLTQKLLPLTAYGLAKTGIDSKAPRAQAKPRFVNRKIALPR
jgi:hypothetical protein